MAPTKMQRSLDAIFDQLEINVDLNQPIAAQLADQLTWFIASGQIMPGERLMAVQDLASRLHISLHTVLAAYRILEQARLVSIRPGRGSVVLDFHPTSFIHNLPDLPTHTVGFIAPDLSGPFYRAIYRGLQEVATQNHFLLVSCGTCENPRIAREQLNMLIAKHVDGLIVVSDYLTDTADTQPSPLGDLSNCPVPLAFIDRPDEKGVSIVFNAEVVGYLATEHLIQHGHPKVGLIVNDRRFPTYRDCYQGYLRALQQYSLPVDISQIVEVNSFSFDAGYRAIATLLAQSAAPPTALFIAEDTLAIGAIRALKDNNLRVPQDIAIVGMNSFDESAFSDPRITSVDTSAYYMGAQAMELIIRMIGGDQIEPKQVSAPTRLIIRESCGCQVPL